MEKKLSTKEKQWKIYGILFMGNCRNLVPRNNFCFGWTGNQEARIIMLIIILDWVTHWKSFASILVPGPLCLA